MLIVSEPECIVSAFQASRQNPHLPAFELGDFDGAPALCRSDECTEHQLQNGSLAKGVGNDLETAALLDEQAFKQIRGSDRPAVCHRESGNRRCAMQASKSSMKQAAPGRSRPR